MAIYSIFFLHVFLLTLEGACELQWPPIVQFDSAAESQPVCWWSINSQFTYLFAVFFNSHFSCYLTIIDYIILYYFHRPGLELILQCTAFVVIAVDAIYNNVIYLKSSPLP